MMRDAESRDIRRHIRSAAYGYIRRSPEIRGKESNMNIVVCIKQVPDTTEVKLDPKTGTLIREGIPSIMNPDDKAA